MIETQTFTLLLIADFFIIVTDFAADLNVVPELHQMTDDILDLLCQAEHILFQSTVTFLLQQ